MLDCRKRHPLRQELLSVLRHNIRMMPSPENRITVNPGHTEGRLEHPLKRQITLRLDEPTIDYFRGLSDDLGIPYQTLINLYLRDCASKRKRPSFDWKPAA